MRVAPRVAKQLTTENLINLEKFHIWVGIQASAKYPLHK